MNNRETLQPLEQRINEEVLRQEAARMLISAQLCDGHVLLEGLPGLAKTRAVRALSRQIEGGKSPHPVYPVSATLGHHRQRDLSGVASENGI